MSEQEQYYSTDLQHELEDLICAKCNLSLTLTPISLSYLGHAFPVELPACPQCGMIFVPEELATGKILHVEQSLEDK